MLCSSLHGPMLISSCRVFFKGRTGAVLQTCAAPVASLWMTHLLPGLCLMLVRLFRAVPGVRSGFVNMLHCCVASSACICVDGVQAVYQHSKSGRPWLQLQDACHIQGSMVEGYAG
jgi:hypothetical protein